MIKYFFLISAIAISFETIGQQVVDTDTLHSEPSENIQVFPLYSDSLYSSFIITVEDSVALHYHEYHTEQIFVIEGEGEMKLGDESLSISEGMWLVIPQEKIHGVKRTGDKPLKVMSIQAPEFKGKDRVFLEGRK